MLDLRLEVSRGNENSFQRESLLHWLSHATDENR